MGRTAGDSIGVPSHTEDFIARMQKVRIIVLRHTAVRVSDIETEVEFYEDLLGYEVVRSFEAADGTRNVFIGQPDQSRNDDAALQLVAADGPVDTGDFVHVALSVQDVDATVANVDDDLVTGEPETMAEYELRVAFIEDPEGWGVELIEQL
jgi:lactoylglutathione lyase